MTAEDYDEDIAMTDDEKAVREIRQLLRGAQSASEGGVASEASAFEDRANEKLGQLLRSKMSRFVFFARRFTHRSSGELYEDTIAEMTYQVARAIKKISGSKRDEFWERKFSIAFERCCLDAIDSVVVQNRKGQAADDDGEGIAEVSYDAWSESAEAKRRPVEDSQALQDFDLMIDGIAREQLMEALHPTKRRAFEMWLAGATHDQIADEIGVSVRTVGNHLADAKETLVSIVTANFSKEQQ